MHCQWKLPFRSAKQKQQQRSRCPLQWQLCCTTYNLHTYLQCEKGLINLRTLDASLAVVISRICAALTSGQVNQRQLIGGLVGWLQEEEVGHQQRVSLALQPNRSKHHPNPIPNLIPNPKP